MVLLIIVFKFMVALVATVRTIVLPAARDMVRVQLQYVANAPALFAQLLGVDPPPDYYTCCGVEQSIQLYYPPPVLRPPPTPTSPGTPTTSSSRRIDIKSTAAPHPHPQPTPAPEGTSFGLAERTPVASAKHWCPSLKTLAALLDTIHAALALFALTYLPKLLVLAYAVVTGSHRYWIPATPTASSRRDHRQREKNRRRLRREKKAQSVAASAAQE